MMNIYRPRAHGKRTHTKTLPQISCHPPILLLDYWIWIYVTLSIHGYLLWSLTLLSLSLSLSLSLYIYIYLLLPLSKAGKVHGTHQGFFCWCCELTVIAMFDHEHERKSNVLSGVDLNVETSDHDPPKGRLIDRSDQLAQVYSTKTFTWTSSNTAGALSQCHTKVRHVTSYLEWIIVYDDVWVLFDQRCCVEFSTGDDRWIAFNPFPASGCVLLVPVPSKNLSRREI